MYRCDAGGFSLCLIVGFLGELTLGHAGFMSIGAYAGALVTLNAPLPGWLSLILGLIVGGIVAAVAGVVIGMPVLRLRGDDPGHCDAGLWRDYQICIQYNRYYRRSQRAFGNQTDDEL